MDELAVDITFFWNFAHDWDLKNRARFQSVINLESARPIGFGRIGKWTLRLLRPLKQLLLDARRYPLGASDLVASITSTLEVFVE